MRRQAPDIASGLVWTRRAAENSEVEPGYYTIVAQAIRAGKIGKVIFFSSRAVGYMDQESKWYKTPWRIVPDYQGGFMVS
ncbi:hypothetical protein OG21DRAFT_1512820 [Imleria badia]|nr:hypothetical protein OG21DRAFT_1512820 [Imleria badia]